MQVIHHGREEVEEKVLRSAEGQVDRDRPRRVVDVVRGERRYDNSRHGAIDRRSAVIGKAKARGMRGTY